MPSELKSAASRANGAKSHGPKTPQGKEKSSLNALNHGFTSKKTIVLDCENEDEFQKMLADYAGTYRPGSPVEKDLVAEMVACRWRMHRLRLMETALLDSEMEREVPESEATDDPGYQLAFAFRRLVDESRAISLASRYESRLHRMHERSHRTLRELQNNPSVSAGDQPAVAPAVEPPPPAPAEQPPSPSDEKSRNEPKPLTPAAARKDHRGPSSLSHRSSRIKRSIRLRQRKPVWWARRFRLAT